MTIKRAIETPDLDEDFVIPTDEFEVGWAILSTGSDIELIHDFAGEFFVTLGEEITALYEDIESESGGETDGDGDSAGSGDEDADGNAVEEDEEDKDADDEDGVDSDDDDEDESDKDADDFAIA